MPLPKGYSHVLEANNSTLGSGLGLKNSRYIYICELGTCPPILSIQKLLKKCQRNFLVDTGVLNLQDKGQFLGVQIVHKELMDSKFTR